MQGDISELLEAWTQGNPEAGAAVVVQTYAELRRVARAYLRRERQGHTLQTTALLHEAYLRLLRTGPGSADTREAFFRLMAAEMRHRLIDHARRRLADKRGGGTIHQPLDSSVVAPASDQSSDVEATMARLDGADAAETFSPSSVR